MPIQFRGVPLLVMAAWMAASCHPAPHKAAAPTPEADQVVSAPMKRLYMAVSAAAPQSAAQQKVVVQMAEQASNGKELLLVMRAAVGVFPAGAPEKTEGRVRSLVTAKMMQVGTLNQLIDYAENYPFAEENARPFVERMFELGNAQPDPRVWNRIRAAAFHLKVGDLEREAQAKADQLAGR